jgi:hypothetical protein
MPACRRDRDNFLKIGFKILASSNEFEKTIYYPLLNYPLFPNHTIHTNSSGANK